MSQANQHLNTNQYLQDQDKVLKFQELQPQSELNNSKKSQYVYSQEKDIQNKNLNERQQIAKENSNQQIKKKYKNLTDPVVIKQINSDDSMFFTKQTLNINDFPDCKYNESKKSEIQQQYMFQNSNQYQNQFTNKVKIQENNYSHQYIQEEVFCSPNPQNLWKYGAWGTITFIIINMLIFSRETALIILKIKLFIWIFIVIVLYLWDIYFLRVTTQEPEFKGNVEFEMTNNFLYRVKNSIGRNVCRCQIYNLKDCFWFTSNISLNLLICNYCRAIWYITYFLKMWVGMVNHKYVHYKATYMFILNGTLYQYINPEGNVVFYNICLPINNYDYNGKSQNMEYQKFDEVLIILDHEKETVVQIRAKKQGNKNYDIIEDKYEIHTFVLITNVFQVHVNSHLMSNLVSELDESDFPQVKKAKIAVNGLNSAGLYITAKFVHGPQVVNLLVNNINQGIPHYPVNENAPWVKKSQMYKLFKAILEDKQICKIAKKYANKKEDPKDRFTTEKFIKVGIACNFAIHGIDHWIHDRFCMVYCYNDYLRWNNIKQGYFGGRWNCDIVSNFNKPCGRISEIIYEIIRKNTPQLLAGFQWTLEQ